MYRFSSSLASTFARRSPQTGAPHGEALHSLSSAEGLRERFFSWRGASGRRYVCSVFQAGEAGFVADVTEGVIVGVARDGAASRAVCLFRAGATVSALRSASQEFGVSEWHVLFGAGDETALDLAASLLN